MSRDPNYCSTCYGAAAKAGRPVRQTELYPYPVCTLCETRLRNGLVRYMPSNGTEFYIFQDRCERCRHNLGADPGDASQKACAWGVLDKLLNGQCAETDSGNFWFDPADLRTRDYDGSPICPAECLKFTDRRDADGELRDPPPPDVEGQLTFSDLLTVPEPAAAAVSVGLLTFRAKEADRV